MVTRVVVRGVGEKNQEIKVRRRTVFVPDIYIHLFKEARA